MEINFVIRSTLKWLSWIILGLILLCLILTLVLHLPPVQSGITSRVSTYLSETTGGDISISGIHLSIWNGIIIDSLHIVGPENNEVLVSRKIRIRPDLSRLIWGNLDINTLELQGLRGQLINTGGELNIQFIIDAFSAPQSLPDSTEKSSFSMVIEQVYFNDILFEYISRPDSINLDFDLGNLEIHHLKLSTFPNKITSESIVLNDVALNIHKTGISEKLNSPGLPPLNFGSGFEFEVNQLELNNHHISYHQGIKKNTQTFDPNHLNLENLQLHLSDIWLSEDTLSVKLDGFTSKLGEFYLGTLSTEVAVGMEQASIDALELSTTNSRLNLDLSAKYDSWTNLLEDIMQIDLTVNTQGYIQGSDLLYFLPDSLKQFIDEIPRAQLELSGHYSNQHTAINNLKLVMGKSQWLTTGSINYLNSAQDRSWQQIEVNATIGQEFRTIIDPFMGELNLPPDIKINLATTGNYSLFEVQSHIISDKGALDIAGNGSLRNQTVYLNGAKITGQSVQLGALLNMPWLGYADFSLGLEGQLGENSDLALSGIINEITINENLIREIGIEAHYQKEAADLRVNINDSSYYSILQSDIRFDSGFEANTRLELKNFSLGRLTSLDNSLIISANLLSQISIDDPSTLDTELSSSGISIVNDTIDYQIDSLAFHAKLSVDSSIVRYRSDNLLGNLRANFDLREAPDMIQQILAKKETPAGVIAQSYQTRSCAFEVELFSDKPLRVFDENIDYASEIHLAGLYDGSSQLVEIRANAGKFSGYGFALDTLYAHARVKPNIADIDVQIHKLFYDTLDFGDLQLKVINQENNMLYSEFSLQRDSVTLVEVNSHLQSKPGDLSVYIDSLVTFNVPLSVDPNNPILISNRNVLFDDFTIGRDESRLMLNGDLDEFELLLDNIDLTRLNLLVSPDSNVIYHGRLDALVAFTKADNHINLRMGIDSLTFMDSPALDIRATAVTENQHIPFSLILKSTTNNIELNGDYDLASHQIGAQAEVDIQELEMFGFLLTRKLDKISGHASGKIDITGSPSTPKFQGVLKLQEVDLVTYKPKSSFHIKDEALLLNESGLVLDNFVIYDPWQNPLRLNGFLLTEDYRRFEYDLKIETDNYLLMNNPRQEEYQLQGILVVGSNLEVKGNERDTRIDASITIKDTTQLTYIMPQKDLELLSSEGIVEFIDPDHIDTLNLAKPQSFYDSLIATFPEFNLKAEVKLEERATIQMIVDARSGDYIEVAGEANLRTEIDRSGNMLLEGRYSIRRGFYQLSFYDLVKKRFDIVPGSFVRWTGDPKSGELNFKAVHKINSSSIGLIGHEIGESERELYRKSLPYEVGILITGTLDEPVISFELNLPQDEKLNYPALANKLERLKQPEFESELNKQVFGLLVLGGFIPESSTSDFDQSLIATTALSNSVNSILASQLNRLAGELVKGVDVNVALQSYSDFSGGSGGSKTRTAMDVRLTKRMMNDRLSIEVGGGVDINSDQSGANTGNDSFRGDITVIYNLTESGSKQLKFFNNETYDIIYHEIRNTGISLIFIKDFDRGEKTVK